MTDQQLLTGDSRRFLGESIGHENIKEASHATRICSIGSGLGKTGFSNSLPDTLSFEPGRHEGAWRFEPQGCNADAGCLKGCLGKQGNRAGTS